MIMKYTYSLIPLALTFPMISLPNDKVVEALKPSHFHNGPLTPSPPSSNFDQYYPNINSFQEDDITDIPMMDHESVEERLANWRKMQQLKFENQSPLDAANPRDDDGRMKLLASVSKGSISLFFFILMWRSVHHYELADQSFKGTLRLLMVAPTVLLFLGNMIGCVASLTSSSTNSASRNAKKRMKAVLNLNKLVELSLIVYNVFRLIFFPSKYIVKEVYVGRTLTNFLFIIQLQLFTKVTWGAAQVNRMDGIGYQDYSAPLDNNKNYQHPFEGLGYPDSVSHDNKRNYQDPYEGIGYQDRSSTGQWQS